jgi:ribA/ribD-fused uncharacterized protein
MNAGLVFLEDLLAKPDADDVRLIFADWLEEHGASAAAEFLRLEWQIHRLDPESGTSRRLGKRLRTLGRPLCVGWLAVVSRPRLLNTYWRGTDSDGDDYIYRFLPGNLLRYTSPSGVWEGATWRQTGPSVYMETSGQYSEYEGSVRSKTVAGNAWNVVHHRWTWEAHRRRRYPGKLTPERCGITDPRGTAPMSQVINFYNLGEPFGEFSNFARFPIKIAGKNWPTSEHYFQAMKFKGQPREEEIRLAGKPMEAARLGRDRKVPLRRDWESVKDNVMREAVRAKFTQHDDLRALLLSTGDARLVEHTENDSYWGDGGDGSGRNMLGQILVEIREELRTREAGA